MKDNKYIKAMTEKLIGYSDSIETIYLVSVKVDTLGELTSFKLGLIVDDTVKSTSEFIAKLYIDIDCELPYDIIVYTQSEFDSLKDDNGTFANKIISKGTVLYGKGLS